jgi:hypothetical protein
MHQYGRLKINFPHIYNTYIKYIMGCWDVFCPLCGCTLNGMLFDTLDELTKSNGIYSKNFHKIPEWLFKVSVLLPNKSAKHGFQETACNIEFTSADGKYTYDLDPLNMTDDEIGIAVHTDCWKFVYKKFKHKLVFEDFDTKKTIKLKHYLFKNLSYKPANKYWDQDFDIEKLENNKKDWYIMYSPLGKTKESVENAKRIKKNIKKLLKKSKKQKKVKKLKDRPSPSESATSFNVGTKKKGNDGNNNIIDIFLKDIQKYIHGENELSTIAQIYYRIELLCDDIEFKRCIRCMCRKYFNRDETVFDLNTSILGFVNGVWDFNERHFRDGKPSDMIYKTVGYEYKEFLSDDAVFVEIDQFFLQYFQTTL